MNRESVRRTSTLRARISNESADEDERRKRRKESGKENRAVGGRS